MKSVVIYMDDESHTEMNQDENAAWDRALHAKLVDYLRQDHARSITFDVVFNNPGPSPGADQSLAKAIQDSGKVVLAADVVSTGIGRGVLSKTIIPPLELFTATQRV